MMQLDEVSALTGLSIDALAKRCQRGELPGEKVPKKPGSKILVWALPDATIKQLLHKDGTRPFDELIAEWEEFQRNGRLTKRRLEPRTISLNTYYIGRYFHYLGKEKDISGITSEDFEICMANWQAVDKEKQQCHFAGKMNAYKAVRSFVKYLIKVGLKHPSLLDELLQERPKEIYQPKRHTVSKEELKELLDKNQDNLEGGRDDYDVVLTDMIVKILGLGGLRHSELIGVRLEHFSARKKELLIPASISKTHRDREVGLRPDLCKAIQEYVKMWRPKEGSQNLLLQRNGQPITMSVVRGRLKRVGKKAGLKRSHPHMFRRAFATIHADMGVPISHLRDQLGHTKESTTELYLRTASETAKMSLKNLELDAFDVVKPKGRTLKDKLDLIDKL